MKISKLMTKLSVKRDKHLRFAQRYKEAMDVLSVIFIKYGDKDVDSDIYYDKIHTENDE